MKTQLLALAFACAFLAGCSDEGTGPTNDVATAAPEIISLTSEKMQILYGGEDPAIITCQASGGGLSYVWEVDLGDIIPLNESRSKISFNGSACCVGEKVITCTVSNALGSTKESIVINIMEEVKAPEIIVMQTDREVLNAGKGETATLSCFATGGALQFEWKTDCGEVIVSDTDPYFATLKATAECTGTTTVTCTVSNEKGSVTQDLQIQIVN